MEAILDFEYNIAPHKYSLRHAEEISDLKKAITKFVTDRSARRKALNYVSSHRNTLPDPDFLFTNKALSKLLADSGKWKTDSEFRAAIEAMEIVNAHKKRAEVSKYFNYCEKMIRLIGFISLEDRYVRVFLFSGLATRDKYLLNASVRKSVEHSLLEFIGKKSVSRFSKRLKAQIAGKDIKISQKIHAYSLYIMSNGKKSFRRIGNEVGIDKQTAIKYVQELKDMSNDERKEFFGVLKASFFSKTGFMPESFDEGKIASLHQKRSRGHKEDYDGSSEDG